MTDFDATLQRYDTILRRLDRTTFCLDCEELLTCRRRFVAACPYLTAAGLGG